MGIYWNLIQTLVIRFFFTTAILFILQFKCWTRLYVSPLYNTWITCKPHISLSYFIIRLYTCPIHSVPSPFQRFRRSSNILMIQLVLWVSISSRHNYNIIWSWPSLTSTSIPPRHHWISHIVDLTIQRVLGEFSIHRTHSRLTIMLAEVRTDPA